MNRALTQPFSGGMATERFVTRLVSHIILIAFVIMMAYPVVWMVMSSFKTQPEFVNNTWGLPNTLTFENYTHAWERAKLGRAFLNSFLIASTTVILVLIAASLAGYGDLPAVRGDDAGSRPDHSAVRDDRPHEAG